MNPVDVLREAVRDVPDFPQPGIIFKDITPVLADGRIFRLALDQLTAQCEGQRIAKIAGIDARGFIFGAAVADRLGLGFIPIRKKGKLPWTTKAVSYQLEYGVAEIEVHTDAFAPGERVALIDDLLATGGTAAAAISLIQKLGAEVVQAQFLVELSFLSGRAGLSPCPVKSVLIY